jgi:hypothetical protein
MMIIIMMLRMLMMIIMMLIMLLMMQSRSEGCRECAVGDAQPVTLVACDYIKT